MGGQVASCWGRCESYYKRSCLPQGRVNCELFPGKWGSDKPCSSNSAGNIGTSYQTRTVASRRSRTHQTESGNRYHPHTSSTPSPSASDGSCTKWTAPEPSPSTKQEATSRH